jgi:hypothetical protein
MKQLSIIVAKNTTINNLVASPNAIVLAKQGTTVNPKTGEVTTSVRYIEVCNVEKTDALAIVQSLLKYCVAEFLVCNELERDFAETNIKQRKLFNQFLSGNTIYRTNGEGKVANALTSEVPFSQTALKVKDYHTIATCKKENLKAAIYQHAKAILSQCKYLRLIIDKAQTLEAETDAKPAQTKPQATPATATVPAPVPVAKAA